MPTLAETKDIRTVVKTGGDTLLAKIHEGKHDEGLAIWRNAMRRAFIQTCKGQDQEASTRLADALGYQNIESVVIDLKDIINSALDPTQKATALGKAYEKLGEGLGKYNGLTFGIAAKSTVVPDEANRPADKSLDQFRLEYVLTH